MQARGPASTHRFVWAALAACGLVVVVAGLLDGFSVRIDGYLGAGNSQRSIVVVEQTHTLLGYGHPRYLGALALVLAAVGAAAWGWRGARTWAPLAVILAAAVIALSLTSAALEPEGGSGGAFLSDAVSEAKAAAYETPVSRDPRFGLSGYWPEPAIGWRLTQGAFYALLAISSIALGRRVRFVGEAAGMVALVAVVLVTAIPSPDCSTGEQASAPAPAYNPIGLLGVFAGLACTGLGLGALSRRAWLQGGVAVVVGLFTAAAVSLMLAAAGCAFY